MPTQLLLTFLLTWGLLIAVFCGCGLWMLRPFNLVPDRLDRWFLAFWIGWAGVLVFLQMWHFAFPINAAARIVIGIVGLSGLLVNGWAGLRLITNLSAGKIIFALLMLLFSVWLANRSINFPENVWDTGLYHVQAVEWASSYEIVPGLGNLHSRFGFSTTFFLYGALLNTGFWLHRTFHIANGLLFLVLFIQMSASLYALLRARRFSLYHVFNAAFVPVIGWLMVAETYLPTALTPIPTLSNDPPIFALGLVTASQLICLITHKDEAAKTALFRLFFIVLVSSIGVAIKFNHIIPGALMSLLALVVWVRRYAPEKAIRITAYMALAAAAVFVPMFARSVIYTGYPLYPLTIAPFPVDWRMDGEVAATEMRFIRAFARDSATHFEEVGDDWLETWLEANLRPRLTRSHLYFTVPLALMVMACTLLLSLRFIAPLRKRTDTLHPALWMLLGAMVISLTYWFLTAPAVRFAGATLWILGIGAASIIVTIIRWGERRWPVLLYCAGVIFLIFVPFLAPKSLDFWIEPEGEGGLHTITEAVRLEQFTTDSGLVVWHPRLNNKCWFAPLPCTPYPHPNLRLRVPGEMRHGFDIDIGPDDPPRPIN